ncbi:hypothetical protein CFHF_22825 [Caulobacter flavus]|uniref:Flagellar hook-length control protein FliK n=1 Tax=Caulobacter flavus TaxID=1679497 RepID=A0A2N5CMG5_9CAUL|nr:hypothetical protein [Caulobacter flavus]AYV45744.1 hypothetical protein C1707_05475 [Caulobacter flavus]PLR07215.1 hypothetical protein CFHF_22825 [Caulobacter flavus]
MSTVRPTGLPAVAARPTSSAVSPAGQSRAAAFFQAAVTDATSARPAASPMTVQLQTQTEPQARRTVPPKAFTAPTEQPQKILRPGSLLNILV